MVNSYGNKSIGSKIFDVANLGFSVIMVVIMLFPFLNVFAVSISDYSYYARNPMMIFPGELDFTAYKVILSNHLLVTSYRNTIFIATVGTFVNMVITILTAYPLSKCSLKGNRVITAFIIFTMLFNGGMIPTFLLVNSLNLYNTLWALILPTAVSTYNLILMRNFFSTIPDSIEESARIDGGGDLTILFRIILPLSKPALAAVTLFYAVANWNVFYNAVLYTSDRTMWTLQVLLREIIVDSLASNDPSRFNAAEESQVINPQTVKTAAIMVTVLPILLVYPFLQKHFVKGVMIGSVKQ